MRMLMPDSSMLKKIDATTLVRLLHHTPNGSQLRGLFDFKSWMEPNLRKVKHISKPHHYLCKCGTAAEIETFYKIAADDPNWLPLGGPIIVGVLEGTPDVLSPMYMEKIKADLLQNTIRKCRHLFTSPEEEKWWEGFILGIKLANSSPDGLSSYANEEAVWLLPNLPLQKPVTEETMVELPEHLQAIMDDQFNRPVVSL